MRIIFKILLIIIALSSCNRKKQFACESATVDIYSEEISAYIDYEEIDIDYLFSFPEALLLDSNKLIIKEEHSKNKLFHVIDLSTGELLQEFAERGNAPNEYISSTLNVYYNSNTKELSFFDPNGKKYHNFIGDLNNNYRYNENINMNFSESIREVVKSGDNYILTGENGTFDEYRFIVTDKNGNILYTNNKYPCLHPYLNGSKENLRQMLYNSVFYKTSPDEKKLVFATYKGTLIQFIDISEIPDSIGTIKSVLLDYPMKQEKNTKDAYEWVYGFEDIYTTDKHVYAIYNGKTIKENPMLGQNILVYNWDGQLVNSYKTDLYIRCIAVDEKNNIAYVIACKEESEFFLAKINLQKHSVY